MRHGSPTAGSIAHTCWSRVPRVSSSADATLADGHVVTVEPGVYLPDHGGVRVDSYAGFTRLAPRVALIFSPSGNEAVKYLYGNAFRAPNAYEVDYFTHGDGTPGLGPETISTHAVSS